MDNNHTKNNKNKGINRYVEKRTIKLIINNKNNTYLNTVNNSNYTTLNN